MSLHVKISRKEKYKKQITFL